MRTFLRLLPLALWLVGSNFVHAQESAADQKKAAKLPAGHSVHGEVFNEGPRQKALLMGGTGKVHFPVTTEVSEAQEFFDQGVGQLHGFWYFEAERTFRQVAAFDPGCAMAYWGMAMANIENEKRSQGFIAAAVERKATATERERLWIDGLDAYLADEPKDRKKRRREYLRSLENVIHEFPDDIEAKAFLVVRLWQFKRDLPLSSYEAVNALLEQIFAAEPMHPAHHFRIHLWDGEKPQRALLSAMRCGQASPSIAHMWHMPGHIFSKLRRYGDAAWQQEASARVDHAQMIRDRVLPDQIHNYAHNNEWLIRDLGHVGRVHDAVELAKNMIELPRHPRYNTVAKRGRSASYGRQRLLDTLERYELWDEVLSCCENSYLEPTDVPREQVKRLRAIGLAAWGKRDRGKLRESIIALRQELKAARKKRREARRKARKQARDDEKPQEDIDRAAEKASTTHDRRIDFIGNTLVELRGYRDLLLGRKAAARKRFDDVKDLDRSHLARLILATGDTARAEELAREAVESDDRRVAPLANYVDLLRRAGKIDEATAAFEKLRALSATIDLDVPVFARLEPLARELELPVPDWRIETVVAEDVGERPDLDSLGPFRWSPPPAPEWNLPRADGTLISLERYRGKSVVVIFYLGYGCLHCVEQIETFTPRAREFEAQGVPIIAISTETREQLTIALENFKKDGKSPGFPLLADPDLEIFKAYRAYDDFEKQPLHGTFLIDRDGLVRWQDISYEPFNDPDFILAEARRQLGARVKLASF